jgi:hypothetical protein
MPTRQTERDDIDRDRAEDRFLKHSTGDGRPTSDVRLIFDDIKVELKADRQAAAGVDALSTAVQPEGATDRTAAGGREAVTRDAGRDPRQ